MEQEYLGYENPANFSTKQRTKQKLLDVKIKKRKNYLAGDGEEEFGNEEWWSDSSLNKSVINLSHKRKRKKSRHVNDDDFLLFIDEEICLLFNFI